MIEIKYLPECVAELIITGGKAGSIDISVTEVDSSVKSEDSDVVAQSLPVKLRMNGDPGHAVFFMLILLGSLECTRVPFTNSHFQTTKNDFH